MQVSRRGFLKISAAGISGLAAVQLGIDLTPIKAYAAATKLEGSKEAISICPFCSCGCNVLVHSKDGKIINVEGDPDFPISDGGLCAKGASLKSLHMSPERLTKPVPRALQRQVGGERLGLDDGAHSATHQGAARQRFQGQKRSGADGQPR